jgi:hypothetical protein
LTSIHCIAVSLFIIYLIRRKPATFITSYSCLPPPKSALLSNYHVQRGILEKTYISIVALKGKYKTVLTLPLILIQPSQKICTLPQRPSRIIRLIRYQRRARLERLFRMSANHTRPCCILK